MGFMDLLKNPALLSLIKDQRLREIVTRREIRVSEEYFHREFVCRALDEEIQELTMKFLDGHVQISGTMKKKLLPFGIPFSASCEVERVDFTPKQKKIYLSMAEVKPLDVDWVTRKLVAKIPFLSYGDGLLACDLTLVPRLAYFFGYHVKGITVCDFLTIKELLFREGELVGRLGVCL
jgi:hypothetical protein